MPCDVKMLHGACIGRVPCVSESAVQPTAFFAQNNDFRQKSRDAGRGRTFRLEKVPFAGASLTGDEVLELGVDFMNT